MRVGYINLLLPLGKASIIQRLFQFTQFTMSICTPSLDGSIALLI